MRDSEILKPFDNVPEDYVPDNRPKEEEQETIKHPLGVYNANGILLGYTWNASDNLKLTIADQIEKFKQYIPEGMPIEEALARSQYVFIVYNHRDEEIHKSFINADRDFKIEVSDMKLDADVYGFKLIIELFAKQINELEPQPQLETHTLIEKGEYSLYIK